MTDNWWTEERTNELIRLWTAGKSGTEIKVILGAVSRSAVIGKVHRLKLPKRPANDRSLGRINGKAGLAKQRAEAAKLHRSRDGVNNGAFAYNVARRLAQPKPRVEAAPIVLDATHARPWIERGRGQCAYPVGGEGADTVSCCAPSGDHTYCAGHRKVMFVPTQTLDQRLARVA